MDMDDFTLSLESLDSIVAEYDGLQQQMGMPPPSHPRLKIVT